MKDHRINLRVDRATYERIANYADKNTFREISEGTRRLILEGLKSVNQISRMGVESPDKCPSIEQPK